MIYNSLQHPVFYGSFYYLYKYDSLSNITFYLHNIYVGNVKDDGDLGQCWVYQLG